MLQVQITCVGKLKERSFLDACKEFEKRLSRYIKLSTIEVPDEKAPQSYSKAQIEQIKQLEGERLLGKIAPDCFVVALAIDGESFSSESWAKWFESKMTAGISKMAFVIGGSNGLSQEVLDRANATVSFSSFTFSHQLMRLILLEQIYRAMKINSGETYHK